MSENAYGKALQEAFDSKTPAEHLATSKYLARQLGVRRDRIRQSGDKDWVTYLLFVEAGAQSMVTRPVMTQAEIDVGHRLLKRITKGGTIKLITVHRRIPAAEMAELTSISFPTVLF